MLNSRLRIWRAVIGSTALSLRKGSTWLFTPKVSCSHPLLDIPSYIFQKNSHLRSSDPLSTYQMAHSLSSECTPLKLTYDTCFNAWFEGYLQPLTSTNGQGGAAAPITQAQKEQRYKQKAEEYEAKCGQVWRDYRICVEVSFIILFWTVACSPEMVSILQKAVHQNGLTTLLNEARAENPLKNPLPAISPAQSNAQSTSWFHPKSLTLYYMRNPCYKLIAFSYEAHQPSSIIMSNYQPLLILGGITEGSRGET